MRDPERIRRICDKLAALWVTQPDTRLGQLIVNLSPRPDPFHFEDDLIEREIDRALVSRGIDPGDLTQVPLVDPEVQPAPR